LKSRKGAAGSGPLDNKTECRNLVTSYRLSLVA
jgi:hypothetical protein